MSHVNSFFYWTKDTLLQCYWTWYCNTFCDRCIHVEITGDKHFLHMPLHVIHMFQVTGYRTRYTAGSVCNSNSKIYQLLVGSGKLSTLKSYTLLLIP